MSEFPPVQLTRIAAKFDLTDPADISTLGENILSAVKEYKKQSKSPPPTPTPKELHQTFKKLNRQYRDFHNSLKQLGPAEHRLLEDASMDFDSVYRTRDDIFGMAETIAALEKIGILLRNAQRYLPKSKPGPVKDTARRNFIWRLGILYAEAARSQDDIAKGLYARPTRQHDAVEEEECGPFQDFVIAIHEALDIPHQGVDGVIRNVWGRKRKKSAPKTDDSAYKAETSQFLDPFTRYIAWAQTHFKRKD